MRVGLSMALAGLQSIREEHVRPTSRSHTPDKVQALLAFHILLPRPLDRQCKRERCSTATSKQYHSVVSHGIGHTPIRALDSNPYLPSWLLARSFEQIFREAVSRRDHEFDRIPAHHRERVGLESADARHVEKSMRSRRSIGHRTGEDHSSSI